MKKFDFNKIRKILVIKPGAIGDVILTTPVLENLRYHFSEAKIYYLTQKFCKEALTGNPNIDRILTYDLSIDNGWFIIKNIRKQKYDLVIDLFCNPRTALITFMSRAQYKVGYRFRGRTYAYNIKINRRSNEVHNVEFNLDSLRILGLDIFFAKPKFYINSVHREFADGFFKENNLSDNFVIGINPAGTWQTKVWYPGQFAELIKLFDDKYRFVLFWGNKQERKIAENIRSESSDKPVLIPKIDLKYMGAIAEKCKLFVTNDTGPMHIASALGVNLVVLFGPTNPRLQGPLNLNSIVIQNNELSCLGCNLTKVEECPNGHKCMKELPVNRVFSEIINFLKSLKI